MQLVDLNKSFNAVVEKNGEIVSTMGIKEYSDYSGSQVQYVTEDDLRIISSTMKTQLLRVNDAKSLTNYVNSLTKNIENVISYDELQGTSVDYSEDFFNKDILDLNYTYNKAIILSDDIATIVSIETWKDYDEDDKIQIKLDDGTYVLTNIDKIKLIDDSKASETSLENYAISLVGSQDKVIYYGKTK